MSEAISLKKARQLILALAAPGARETIPLDEALGRVTAESLRALLPVPSFDHSTRDGYAARSLDIERATPIAPVTLRVIGEIPAGRTDLPVLGRGQALRIMTGAAIPPGSNLVLAQEDVEISHDHISLDRPLPSGTFIRKKGTDLARGKLILRKGQALAPDHLALLATSGTCAIQVHKKTAVAVICSGNELVPQGEKPLPGQVISSNRLLLDGLIRDCGGTTVGLITTKDQTAEITAKIRPFLSDQIPLIITTGGMGPGKFDLMEEVFAELGIRTIYNSLKVRPGRATMLGIFGRTMLFALPGPPPAVRLLFNELVRPALFRLSGVRNGVPKSYRAELTETVTLRPSTNLHLKGGISAVVGGKLLVRLAHKTDRINCVVFMPPGRKQFKGGEKVTISPATRDF